ncbi:MAG: NUDIX domain-containing protein [Chloroflexota bacterium]
MPHVRVAAKAIVKRDGWLLVTRNVGAEGTFFLLPGGGQEHGESLPEALRRELMEEVGVPIEVHDLVLVRDYIARNHEFAQESDAHQVELCFRCTLLSDTLPANGPHPDCWQTGVEWLDLSGPDATRLYPRVLQRLLLEIDAPGPIYVGNVN